MERRTLWADVASRLMFGGTQLVCVCVCVVGEAVLVHSLLLLDQSKRISILCAPSLWFYIWGCAVSSMYDKALL